MIDFLRRKWALYWLLLDDREEARVRWRVRRELVYKALWRGEGPYG